MSRLPKNFDALLKRHKLEPYRHLFKGAILPAFRMAATRRLPRNQQEPTSKLGGEPHLAWDDSWPSREGRPLHFLGQLRLSDVPRGHLPRKALPDRGWLRFWLDSIGVRMHGTVSPDAQFITFEPDESRPLERRPWPRVRIKIKRDLGGEPWAPFPEAALAFQAIHAVDYRASARLMAEVWNAEGAGGQDRFGAFMEELQADRRDGNHRLLGDVEELQSDMRQECALHARGLLDSTRPLTRAQERTIETEKHQWRLLVRLDSQAALLDWCWGDAGSLNWFIRDEDLKRRAFDRACGIWDNGG